VEYHGQRREMDLLGKALDDQRFIDTATPSEYLTHLIEDILHSEVSMDPKLRVVLKVLKRDLVPVAIVDSEGPPTDDGDLEELDFNDD
jgi:hypothetical protein